MFSFAALSKVVTPFGMTKLLTFALKLEPKLTFPPTAFPRLPSLIDCVPVLSTCHTATFWPGVSMLLLFTLMVVPPDLMATLPLPSDTGGDTVRCVEDRSRLRVRCADTCGLFAGVGAGAVA